jgi:hypothetical protein
MLEIAAPASPAQRDYRSMQDGQCAPLETATAIFARLAHRRSASTYATTLSATLQKKILNADVSRFTLMHADGDTRLKTRRIRYGPCPVNHTDPSACFACIYFHLR